MPVPGNIESGLEAFRRTVAPPVIDGERYLTRRQASYDGGNAMFACWKPGYLLLTPTRLLFYQGETQLFAVALDSVRSVEVLTRRWLSRRDCEQLVVTHQTRRGPRSVCLRTEDLEKWRESIQKHIPEKTETETSEKPTEQTTEPDAERRNEQELQATLQSSLEFSPKEISRLRGNADLWKLVSQRMHQVGRVFLVALRDDKGWTIHLQPWANVRAVNLEGTTTEPGLVYEIILAQALDLVSCRRLPAGPEARVKQSDNGGILPAISRRDEAESTPEGSLLATPWAAYDAWCGRFGHTAVHPAIRWSLKNLFGSPRSLKRRKPPHTSDQESEIL